MERLLGRIFDTLFAARPQVMRTKNSTRHYTHWWRGKNGGKTFGTYLGMIKDGPLGAKHSYRRCWKNLVNISEADKANGCKIGSVPIYRPYPPSYSHSVSQSSSGVWYIKERGRDRVGSVALWISMGVNVCVCVCGWCAACVCVVETVSVVTAYRLPGSSG